MSNKDKKNPVIQVSAGLRSSAVLTESRQILNCGTSGEISKQNLPIELEYKLKLPEIFEYENHQIVKIHNTWNESMSVLYAVIAETASLKVKLNNNQKIKHILSTLSDKWITKDIIPPQIDNLENFISSRHLNKVSKSTAKLK
jgi:hypothetical protein